MKRFTCSAQLDSKGRITIPARIRDRLELQPEDSIRVSISNIRVEKRKVSGLEEALEFLKSFSEAESFSFDGSEVEVIVRE